MPMMKIGKTVFMGEAPTAYIPYSALEYNDSDAISGISGSAIAGGVDPSVMSSYVPYSSLKNGPTTATISAIDASAVYDYSAHARLNTLSTSRIPYSALDYSGDRITSISGSAVGYPDPPSVVTTELIVNSANMSAAVSGTGIVIGVKSNAFATGASVVIVSNSSQATANNVVYIVTG